MMRRWLAKFGHGILLAALAVGPLTFGGETLLAVEANMPKAAEVAKERLNQILLGRDSPETVEDLRLIEQRVQELTEKVIPATVGVQVGHAWGSGVIISKDGYVLTAAHVCQQPGRDVEFRLSDGRVVKGKTLGIYRTLDAGLMKITEPGDYPAVELGKSSEVHERQWCLATGHPGGWQEDRQPVLRLGRVLLTDTRAITTECTLVGGDSGGPLFDMEGRVIGINSRIGSRISANMHVPVNTYRDNWDRMVQQEAWGYLEGHEPYIGIRGENKASTKIAQVSPDSPAARIGLKAGDVILTIDGQQVSDFDAFRNAISDHQPGEKIRLQVQRGDETLDFNVKLARKSD